MPSFKKFKKAIDNQFSTMAGANLFRTNVDKDLMWATYNLTRCTQLCTIEI